MQAGGSELTGTGQILGTPSYMPPEQAIGQPSLVREAADIYALGAILYALLTGRPPFQADNPLDTLRQVLEREPVPPRQLNPAIPLDLETICLKCLEKPATRRYASAQDLAEELTRFLEGKPILARPVGTFNRAWRWCKRNRVVASLLAAVLITLVAGVAVSSYFAYESDRRADDNLKLAKKEETAKRNEQVATKDAQQKTRIALRESANLALNEAQTLCDRRDTQIALLWMARAYQHAIAADEEDLADACRATISGHLAEVPRLEKFYSDSNTRVAALGPDDGTILTAQIAPAASGLLTFDPETEAKIDTLAEVNCAGTQLAISPDRSRLLLQNAAGRFQIWSPVERKWQGGELSGIDDVDNAQFSPNGKLLATASSSGLVKLWNGHDGTATGVSIRIEKPASQQRAKLYVLFSRDGRTLWVGGTRGELSRWSPQTGESRGASLRNIPNVSSMARNPVASQLAIGTGRIMQVYRTDEEPMRLLYTHDLSSLAADLAFSPDGRFLATANQSNRVQLFEAATGQPFASPAMTRSYPRTVEWTKTGRHLVTAGVEGLYRWNLPARATAKRLHRPDRSTQDCAFHLGKKLIAIRDNASRLSVVQLDTGSLVADLGELPAETNRIEFTSLGDYLILQLKDGQIGFGNLSTKTIQFVQGVPPTWMRPFERSPEGRFFATIDEKVVQLFDLHAGKQVGKAFETGGDRHPVSFSGNGELFSIHDPNAHCLRIFRTSDGLPAGDPLAIGMINQETSILHPDGKRALVGMHSTVELWDLVERKRIAKLGTHDVAVNGIKATPDGIHAISWSSDQAVRVWDVEAGRQVGRTMRGVGMVSEVKFSPDGRLVGFHATDAGPSVWHLRSGRRVLPKIIVPGTGLRHFDFGEDATSYFQQDQQEIYPLIAVPEGHEQLTRFVETWTGLTLEQEDVRSLSRNEWNKRKVALAATGWKDTVQPPKTAPGEIEIPKQPEFKEPIIIEAGLQDLRGIVYSGDGTRLAVCSNKQTKVWEAATQKLVQEFPGLNSGSLAICLSRDGELLLAGGGFGLKWWNVETGALERTKRFEGNIVDIALSPDEQLVAIAQQWNRSIHVLRRDTGEVVQTLDIPIGQPAEESKADSKVKFSPDGKSLIASAGGRGWPDYVGEDSAIAVWDVGSWKLRASFTADKYDLDSLAISPDSQWIAAANHGGRSVNLWRVPESSEAISATASLARVIESTYRQSAVVYSPDGRLLAHSSHAAELGTVVLEKLDSKATVVLPTFDGAWGLAFSPNGKQLATCSRNGTVSIWDIEDLTDPAKSKKQASNSIRPLHESEVARLLTQDKSTVEREVAKLLAQGKEAIEKQHGELKALPVLQRARELQQYLVTKDTADPAARAMLGEIYEKMGIDRYNAQPRPAATHAALADLQHAVEALEIAIRHKDAKATWGACLIDADALTISASGDINREEKALKRIVDLQTRFGDDLAIQRAKGRLLASLAQLFMKSDHASAIRRIDEANAIFLKVFATNGDPQAIDVVARGTSNQSYMVMNRPFDDPERIRIREATSGVVPLIDQVYREHPDVPAYAISLAAVLTNQGQYDYYDGNMASAAPLFERAGDIFRKRLEQGQNVQGLARRKDENYDYAAYCFSRVHDDEAALREAIEIADYVIVDRQKLKREAPHGVYNAMAVAKLRLGDPAAAKAAMDKTFAIRKTPDADDLFWRAAILYKLGDKEKADADWQAAEAWMKANPTVAPLVMALAQRQASTYRPAAQ